MASRVLSFGYSVQMREMQCGQCGVCFAAPEAMMAEKERDGGNWYCPNGHPRVYSEPDAQKFKRLYEEEQRKRFQAESQKAEAERKLLRTEKRIKGGVCPCCKRSFVSLGRHMKTKHPEFATA